jgi:hypothetical protein
MKKEREKSLEGKTSKKKVKCKSCATKGSMLEEEEGRNKGPVIRVNISNCHHGWRSHGEYPGSPSVLPEEISISSYPFVNSLT